MAGEVPPLNVEVLVSLGNLTNAVNQATEGLNKIGNTAKAQESKFASLKAVMVGTFAGGAALQGIHMFSDFLKESVKAAEQAQLSTTQLATAMNAAKINTEANRKVVEASIGSMEKLAFTHTDATQAMTKMVLATGSVANSQKEMATVADYARVKQISLSDAATVLTKASGGAVKAFKEYHITLDTTISKHDALVKAMDELHGKIKDQAAAYLKTYAGQMADLNVKMEKVKETVGAVLLPILRKLAEMFSEVSSFVAKHKDLMIIVIAVIGTALVAALVAATTAAYAMIAPFVAAIAPFAAVAAVVALLWNHFKIFRTVVVDAVEIIIKALGYLIGFIGKLLEAASHIPGIGSHFKGVAAEVNKAAVEVGNFGGKLDALKNKKISLNFKALEPDLAGGASGGAGGSGYDGADVAGSKANKAAAAHTAKLQKVQDQIKTIQDKEITILQDRQTKMDAITVTHDDAVEKANTKHAEEVLNIQTAYEDKMIANKQTYNDAVENATDNNEQKIIDIKQQYADKATALQQKALDDQAKIIQQSIDVMTNAFANATKVDIGKLFTSTGSSASGLLSGLQGELDAAVQLQKDAGLLAAQGYNQSFINEVISQGSKQGDALAQSVLKAAPATQNSIKSLYNQIQDVSSNGLNDLAKQMNDGSSFATKQLAQAYAGTSVTLKKALSDNSEALTDALAKQQDAFQKQLDAAQVALDKSNKAAADARDLALQRSQQALTNSLTAAQESYNKSMTAINNSTMKQLDTLQTKLLTVMALMKSLTTMGGGGGSAYSPSTTPKYGTYGSSGTGAGYGVTYGPGIGAVSPAAPIIGSLTQNVYTTDPSLPTITTGLTNAISVGQTQGLMSKPLVVSTQR